MTSANFEQPRVAMIQDGARLNYLVPLALQRAGILERVFVDWFVRENSIQEKVAGIVAKGRPQLGRKMAERSCPELDRARVIDSPLRAIWNRSKMRRFAVSEDSYIWESRRTAEWIERKGFGDANALHGFIRNAAPEIYAVARARGLKTSGDQIIAPLEIEFAEMQKQLSRWPGWSDSESIQMHADYLRREQQSWQEVDEITCASDYVRDGLISVGVAADKIKVIPYPWMDDGPEGAVRRLKKGPLLVGFVGAVGLRKGAPWFLEVARRFDPQQVRFAMVGKVMLDPRKVEAARGNVELIGPVPRSQVDGWLRRFDVFLFPTTCEGSAGAVMEAMGRELPVLTTPNSGTIARDGLEGFIRACDDVDGFEQAIRGLDQDRELLLRMGQAARARVLTCGIDAYEAAISAFFGELIQKR